MQHIKYIYSIATFEYICTLLNNGYNLLYHRFIYIELYKTSAHMEI